MEEIKEKFYVGLYQKVISDASAMKGADEEIEFIVLRSRILIGQADFVLNYAKSQETPLQKGVYILAKAKKCATPEEISALIPTDDETLYATSEVYAISKATACLQAERVTDALAIISNNSHPEAVCLKIQCLLQMNRADLAEKELENINNQILKNIWTAFVALYQGKDEIQRSLFALQDLAERFESSPLLANAMACCHFALGEWENGNMDIQSTAENYPNDEAIQINKAVVAHRTNDYEKLKTQISLVTSMNNKYMRNINDMLKDFDETATRLENE